MVTMDLAAMPGVSIVMDSPFFQLSGETKALSRSKNRILRRFMNTRLCLTPHLFLPLTSEGNPTRQGAGIHDDGQNWARIRSVTH